MMYFVRDRPRALFLMQGAVRDIGEDLLEIPLPQKLEVLRLAYDQAQTEEDRKAIEEWAGALLREAGDSP